MAADIQHCGREHRGRVRAARARGTLGSSSSSKATCSTPQRPRVPAAGPVPPRPCTSRLPKARPAAGSAAGAPSCSPEPISLLRRTFPESRHGWGGRNCCNRKGFLTNFFAVLQFPEALLCLSHLVSSLLSSPKKPSGDRRAGRWVCGPGRRGALPTPSWSLLRPASFAASRLPNRACRISVAHVGRRLLSAVSRPWRAITCGNAGDRGRFPRGPSADALPLPRTKPSPAPSPRVHLPPPPAVASTKLVARHLQTLRRTPPAPTPCGRPRAGSAPVPPLPGDARWHGSR